VRSRALERREYGVRSTTPRVPQFAGTATRIGTFLLAIVVRGTSSVARSDVAIPDCVRNERNRPGSGDLALTLDRMP
jgi:hypothetical protein